MVRVQPPLPFDPLAQSVEHLTFNQGVPRSSRGWVTSLRPLGQAVKTPPFHGGNRGSIPLGVTICGLIAQLGEHLPYKQGVTGSSPVGPTTCGCGGIGRRTRLRIWRPVRGGSSPSNRTTTRKWLSGRASPCQGDGREFESRFPLQKFFCLTMCQAFVLP